MLYIEPNSSKREAIHCNWCDKQVSVVLLTFDSAEFVEKTPCACSDEDELPDCDPTTCTGCECDCHNYPESHNS